MQRFIQFLLLLLPAVYGAKYDGMFKLKDAQDEHHETVTIPGEFNLVLRSIDESRYTMSFRVGNTLRAEMGVTESEDGTTHDSVHIGRIMSTMMMPPEKIFKLEQFMSSNLPKMTTIYFEDNGNKLIMEGEAIVEFTRE